MPDYSYRPEQAPCDCSMPLFKERKLVRRAYPNGPRIITDREKEALKNLTARFTLKDFANSGKY